MVRMLCLYAQLCSRCTLDRRTAASSRCDWLTRPEPVDILIGVGSTVEMAILATGITQARIARSSVVPSPRILAIDDDPMLLSVMRRGLAFAGYTVDLAADGEEALTIARNQFPDLVHPRPDDAWAGWHRGVSPPPRRRRSTPPQRLLERSVDDAHRPPWRWMSFVVAASSAISPPSASIPPPFSMISLRISIVLP